MEKINLKYGYWKILFAIISKICPPFTSLWILFLPLPLLSLLPLFVYRPPLRVYHVSYLESSNNDRLFSLRASVSWEIRKGSTGQSSVGLSGRCSHKLAGAAVICCRLMLPKLGPQFLFTWASLQGTFIVSLLSGFPKTKQSQRLR